MKNIDLDQLSKGLPGLSPNFGKILVEAGSLCLELEGHNTGVELDVFGKVNQIVTLHWKNKITYQIQLTWGDQGEATEFGAICIGILLALKLTDFTVIQRSWRGTGFDYWLGYVNNETSSLFTSTARLEISGIQKGDKQQMKKRSNLRSKQTEQSDNTGLPAYIVVVEFSNPMASFQKR